MCCKCSMPCNEHIPTPMLARVANGIRCCLILFCNVTNSFFIKFWIIEIFSGLFSFVKTPKYICQWAGKPIGETNKKTKNIKEQLRTGPLYVKNKNKTPKSKKILKIFQPIIYKLLLFSGKTGFWGIWKPHLPPTLSSEILHRPRFYVHGDNSKISSLYLLYFRRTRPSKNAF